MSDLVVVPVSGFRQRRQFLHFPWTLYKSDPYWIPPLRMDQREMVGYARHPFYDRNEIQTFLAYRNGKPCGRIAAILNRGHIERYHDNRGFFGFFESIDDQEVADGLFEAARQWFAQRGIHALRGPCNPSLNYALGLLVDGFDSSPKFMMTYNPPYYERLIENYGFRKTQDLYAYWGHIDWLPKVAARYGHIADQLVEHHGLKLRPLNPRRFVEEVKMFLDIYNRSLVNTWGFVPMSDREVRHLANGLRYLIVPELAIGAEIEGRPVGAAFALLDYNPRIRQINGRLFPLGFLRLLFGRRRIKGMRVISANVIPEFQRLGVGLALLHGLAPRVVEWGIQEVEFSWVLESNSLSRGALEKGGAKIAKTYRLYDLDMQPK